MSAATREKNPKRKVRGTGDVRTYSGTSGSTVLEAKVMCDHPTGRLTDIQSLPEAEKSAHTLFSVTHLPQIGDVN